MPIIAMTPSQVMLTSFRHFRPPTSSSILYAAFANFFSDDMSDDTSTYYPSMYDDIRDQATAGTAGPRRGLRKLLLLVRSSLSRPPLSSPYRCHRPSRVWG